MITINRLPLKKLAVNNRVSVLNRRPFLLTKRNSVVTRVSPDLVDSLNTGAYILGKGIILFTMFYCSMNWFHYRTMRIELEKEKEKNKNKKK